MPEPDALTVDATILERRTCLLMDPDLPVDPQVITELCRLATWAPNHHRTEPWRFAVFSGEGRRRLGETIADQMERDGAPPAKVAKTRVKYLRAPAMLVVGCVMDPDPKTSLENRDAVAAAIQNILLGATARGLGSFWSTISTPDSPALKDLCGFEPEVTGVAAIYLGQPTGCCLPPERGEPLITWVD